MNFQDATQADKITFILRIIQVDDADGLKVILKLTGNCYEDTIGAAIKLFRAKRCLCLIFGMEPRIAILSPGDSLETVKWLQKYDFVATQGEYNIHVFPTNKQYSVVHLVLTGRWLTKYRRHYSFLA